MTGWIPPEQYVRTITQATLYGCLYFTNDRGWPVQLLSVYGESEWQFPGGNTEPGEDPWQTALRECAEETGHLFQGPPDLLLTHFRPPAGSWPLAKVGFIFNGGILQDKQIAQLTLDPREHSDHRVLPLEAWQQLMHPNGFTRLAAVQAARTSGGGAYLAD